MTSKTHDKPHPCSWRMLRLSQLLCRLRKKGHVRATSQPGPNNDHVSREALNSLVSAQTRVMGHVHTRENDKHRFLELPSQPWHGRPAPSGAPSGETLKNQALWGPESKGFGNQNAPTVSPKPAAPVTTPFPFALLPQKWCFSRADRGVLMCFRKSLMY